MIKENLPNHVAIIMDGNGRWAIKKGLPRNKGHQAGANNLINIVEYANTIGIKILTVYAFSTENWSRPSEEVNYLMRLPLDFFRIHLKRLKKQNIKVSFIGSLDKLSQELLDLMQKVTIETKANTGLNLLIALNYGSKDEIIRAINKIIRAGHHEIDQNLFSTYLDTKDYPDVDLVIRTSGEKRISNFLIWQSAYSELYFTDVLWPDFSKNDFDQALNEYQNRQRRYGGLA